tara:strand:- start:3410 stop:3856 length:447 start_codon:yes stop_codon:yes gene_type:complete
MKCPECSEIITKVIDSRLTEKGYTIRRRRECESCNHRFTTYEYVFPKKIVIKKTGVRQDYDRIKLEKSIRISCTKRPVSEQIIQEVMMRIEKKINNFTNIEISSKEIGKFTMDELKSIDKIAFVRFASVYREFKDLGEFKTQIDDISN